MTKTAKLTTEQYCLLVKEIRKKSTARLEKILQYKTHTIYHLTTLKRRDKKHYQSVGICALGKAVLPIQLLAHYWPKYSGDPIFPVFDPLDKFYTKPITQFRHTSLWLGRQKQLRYQLINFLLANIGTMYWVVEQELKLRKTENWVTNKCPL